MPTAQGKKLEIFVSKTEDQAQAYQASNPGAMCFSSDAESLVFDGRTHNFVTAEERAFLNSQLTAANQATVNGKLSVSITTKLSSLTFSSSQVVEVGSPLPSYEVLVSYNGVAVTPTQITASGAASSLSNNGRVGVYTAASDQRPTGTVKLTVNASYKTAEYGGLTATKSASSVSFTYVAPIYIIESATKITAGMTSEQVNALIAESNVIAKRLITSASSLGKINISANNSGRYIYVLHPTSSAQGPAINDVTVSDNSIIKERVDITHGITLSSGAVINYTAVRLTELCSSSGEVISGATFK